MAVAEGYPWEYARTRRFTLGRPRAVRIAPDGSRITFLRTAGAYDPSTRLWLLDLASGTEHVVADPSGLAVAAGDLPAAERARRERAREQHGGIVAYDTDRAVAAATFALGGRLFRADLHARSVAALDAAGPVADPRIDPSGTRIAYVCGGALHVQERDGSDRCLAHDDAAEITYGLPEFIAAEEMGRSRGHWWSPDGTALAVARVDESTVPVLHIADPSTPSAVPSSQRYPVAGADNADVRLFVVDAAGTGRVEIAWQRGQYPYLTGVTWREDEPLTLVVQSRDQRTILVLTADPETGATAVAGRLQAEPWVPLVPGSPRWLPGGRLVTVEDVASAGPDDPEGTRRILIDGRPVSPPGLQVQELAGIDGDGLWFVASRDPTQAHVHRLDTGDGTVVAVTRDPGVHRVSAGGGLAVTWHATLGADRGEAIIRRAGRPIGRIRTRSAVPPVEPRVEVLELGPRRVNAALLRPATPPDGPLPVLLDPYGGPTATSRRVVRARGAFTTSQWFADQGCAVLVVDGRGTPCRSPSWERAISGDLAGPPLEDQIEALHAAAEHAGDLDLDRVAIRGWSFGGFLAAAAVLRRPDVFRAAIAGAPVTDWRLYDTHYTERYLGDPATAGNAYRRSSLVDADADLLAAADLPLGTEAPALLLIHGLADDNVVVAHSLRLSAALLAEGRSHCFLPLSGVTHMASQVAVASNLLWLQARFLRGALGLGPAPARRDARHRTDAVSQSDSHT